MDCALPLPVEYRLEVSSKAVFYCSNSQDGKYTQFEHRKSRLKMMLQVL
jgi:hypothetical protein